MTNFRAQYLDALSMAVAAYPDAKVSLGERGIIMRPSRPAIAKASALPNSSPQAVGLLLDSTPRRPEMVISGAVLRGEA